MIGLNGRGDGGPEGKVELKKSVYNAKENKNSLNEV